MNKETLLIIFTYKYPYDPPVEQFLDDEMKYLSQENVDILLVPISRDNSGLKYKTVETKENISINAIKREAKSKETIYGVLFSIRNVGYIIKDINLINRNVEKRFRRFARKETIKQYVQGGALFHEICRQIPANIFNGRNRIILYSYWLSPTLLAEVFFKKSLKTAYGMDVIAYSRAHGDGDLYHNGLKKFRPCKELLKSEVDCFFAISENGTKYLKGLGVETVSEEYLKSNDVPLIVSCSVVNDNKRVEKIAEILSQINIEIRWVHFGGGPNESRLQKYCEDKLKSNIHWELKGWTSHDEVLKYYKSNNPDLFINVSQVEGIPVSIMEALSFSIPCIATDVGASSEIVIDSENGYLVPKDFDCKKVATLITSYLELGDAKKAEMRRNSYNMYIEKYHAPSNYSAFTNRILQLGE